ncbi:MAG: amidase family protein, partial [Dehalococcoidia bacterium]
MNLYDLSIHEAHNLLKSREISSVELTKSALERIKQVDGDLNAFVTVTENLALSQAQKADERLQNGDATPLTGIPAV